LKATDGDFRQTKQVSLNTLQVERSVVRSLDYYINIVVRSLDYYINIVVRSLLSYINILEE
jgi:hypothetical protein